MSVEMNIATADYLGEEWTFIDCPGSVELQQEALGAAVIADTAIVIEKIVRNGAVGIEPLVRHHDTDVVGTARLGNDPVCGEFTLSVIDDEVKPG